jgi:hypothetical protein
VLEFVLEAQAQGTDLAIVVVVAAVAVAAGNVGYTGLEAGFESVDVVDPLKVVPKSSCGPSHPEAFLGWLEEALAFSREVWEQFVDAY